MNLKKKIGTIIAASALTVTLGASPTSFADEVKVNTAVAHNIANNASLKTETVAANAKTGSHRYKFNYKDSKGRYARWNPCKTITWAYNPARQKAGGLADAKKTIQILSKASGLKFKYVGTTKTLPFKGPKSKKFDLRIGWGNSKTHSSYFSKKSRVAGRGGFRVQYRVINGKTTPPEITSGELVLNSEKKFSRKTQKLLYLHELGHVVGLDHVKWKSEIMYPVVQLNDPIAYGAGDKAGLKKLGKSAGCISNPIR